MGMERLRTEALRVRENAYTPYSHFPVGAALLTAEGEIFTGCNVENASYGLTNCAERTAIFNAVSQGYTRFTTLLTVADTLNPCPPCGACRQVMVEFAPDLTVIMMTLNGKTEEMCLQDLLPGAFLSSSMGPAK